MNIKYLLLSLAIALGLCSCGGNAAGHHHHSSGPGVHAQITIGATTPYLRVGACNPDPRRMNHGRAIPRPMPRPQVRPVIIFQDEHCVHLRMPDGRCVVQPRRQQPRPNPHYNAGYSGGQGNYGGGYRDPYDSRVDARRYQPRERFNPYKYGSMPDSEARNFRGDTTYQGFIQNHPELIGGRPRRY